MLRLPEHAVLRKRRRQETLVTHSNTDNAPLPLNNCQLFVGGKYHIKISG